MSLGVVFLLLGNALTLTNVAFLPPAFIYLYVGQWIPAMCHIGAFSFSTLFHFSDDVCCQKNDHYLLFDRLFGVGCVVSNFSRLYVLGFSFSTLCALFTCTSSLFVYLKAKKSPEHYTFWHSWWHVQAGVGSTILASNFL